MSEVYIDVAWRGLEVSRQVLLREVTGEHGRLDVLLPMPVGSSLTVRTADGLEIPAIVTAVYEQSSIGGERPGMVVVPALAGAARAWWSERAAESAVAVPSSASSRVDDEPAVVIVAAAPAGSDDARGSSPAITVPPEPTPRRGHGRASTTDGTSAVAQLPTALISSNDLRAARAAAIADAAADLADAVAASPRLEASGRGGDGRRTEQMTALGLPDPAADPVADDASRTAIMSAVDVDAIIADGVAHTSSDGNGNGNGDDDGAPGEVSGSHDTSAATGKRKAAARGKRRKSKI